MPSLFVSLLLLLAGAGTPSVLRARAVPAPATSVERPGERERVLAGGPEDFLLVRHLRLAGSQRAIGRRLAELAAERHGWRPRELPDRAARDARRAWFAEHAPLFHDRMRGVADHLGVRLEDTSLSLAALGYGRLRAGCTVAYVPPHRTAWGGGVVARNYDFTTGSFAGLLPRGDEAPVTARPYLLELHPEEGYASLSLCAYDLLGGVIDGINAEGLTVALLADDELSQRGLARPATGTPVGLGVVQVGRHLLETCADAEEAARALRAARLFYGSIPCHYLVADRFGRSFVWENAPSMEEGFVFEGGGEPQVTTNFLYQFHPDREALPREPHALGSFNRYRTVRARIAGVDGPPDRDRVRAALDAVAVDVPVPAPPRAVARTLWQVLYFPEERRLEASFYLGEGPDGPRRSPWIGVALEPLAHLEAAAPAGELGR